MTLGNSQVILLTVSEFAKVCQTTIRTIRFYEKLGLIRPAKIDVDNRYRYYSPLQAREVAHIKLLQHFKIPLKEIKEITHSQLTRLSLRRELEQITKEIQEKQKELEILQSINEIVFETEKTAAYLKQETIGEFRLLVYSIKNGDYHLINSYIDQLKSVADKYQITYIHNEITFFIADEYQPKNTRLEVAIVCTELPALIEDSLPKEYSIRTFPKTMCLVLDYKGPYHFLTAVYSGIDRYLKKMGITTKGPVFEQYVRGPVDTASANDFITKICYPI